MSIQLEVRGLEELHQALKCLAANSSACRRLGAHEAADFFLAALEDLLEVGQAQVESLEATRQ